MSETSPGPGASGPGMPGSSPAPGDGPPRRTLDRPPSARYQAAAADASGRAGATGGSGATGSGTNGLRVAIGLAALGAVASALLNAVLAVTVGLVAVAGVTGYLVGAALRPVSGAGPAGSPADGGTTPARPNRASLAIMLAVLAVLVGAIGAWLVAIPQGNLLDPLDYLGQTLGIMLPLQAVAASVGAWLGSR